MQRTAIQKVRKPVARISAKRLARLGGKLPFSTIAREVVDFPGPRKSIPRKRRHKTKKAITHSRPIPGAKDPRSHFTRDGRTFLYGKDMELLRLAVFFRCNGYCEAKSHASDCPHWMGWDDGELDHIKAKGLGGGWRDDTEANTQWLSPPCHREKHNAINVEKETPCPSPKS